MVWQVHKAKFNIMNSSVCNYLQDVYKKRSVPEYTRRFVCDYGLSTEYFGFSEENLYLMAFDPV